MKKKHPYKVDLTFIDNTVTTAAVALGHGHREVLQVVLD